MGGTASESISWIELLLNAVGTLLAVLLAFGLSLIAYRRQKDLEAFQSRYLDGGVDRLAGHVVHLLAIIRGNHEHGLRVLRLLRDVGFKDAAQFGELEVQNA